MKFYTENLKKVEFRQVTVVLAEKEGLFIRLILW